MNTVDSAKQPSQNSSENLSESLFTPSGAPCLIALEDGKHFKGYAFGSTGTVVGELVFNTSLIGYQEILTDPSYAGQIVTLTYPEIGNYGENDDDLESSNGKIFARALIIRHLSRKHSSWRGTESLPEFMAKQNIIGVTGVDTRAITRHIRDKGAMRCAISTEILDPAKLAQTAKDSPVMIGADFTKEVTAEKPYTIGNGKLHIAVLDYGIKKNILRQLALKDTTLTVFPATATAKEILDVKPHAVFLSNGPGDPAACKEIISELKTLIDSRMPIFGICLGHQLLALAFGGSTYKMKFGHRGGNQPVQDLQTSKIEITSQNHGFAVDTKTLPDFLELTHINLNDQSAEGFRHKTLPVFAVQYHPEACPGPHDSNYLFDRFIDLIESHGKVSI